MPPLPLLLRRQLQPLSLPRLQQPVSTDHELCHGFSPLLVKPVIWKILPMDLQQKPAMG